MMVDGELAPSAMDVQPTKSFSSSDPHPDICWSDILSGTYCDILFGVLSGIPSHILELAGARGGG